MTVANSRSLQQPAIPTQWQPATWADYERHRDDPNLPDRARLFFHAGYLKVDAMGWEGMGHSEVNQLFTLLIGIWLMAHPEQTGHLFGGCLMERSEMQAAAPDLALYVGDGVPTWSKGEKRRIDLAQWRVPDLVGEVSDTTLADDLDGMKQLYAALGIREYWVIDVQGKRVMAFQLVAGKYQQCDTSIVLPGLPIALLEQALDRLTEGTNISAANWFMQAMPK